MTDFRHTVDTDIQLVAYFWRARRSDRLVVGWHEEDWLGDDREDRYAATLRRYQTEPDAMTPHGDRAGDYIWAAYRHRDGGQPWHRPDPSFIHRYTFDLERDPVVLYIWPDATVSAITFEDWLADQRGAVERTRDRIDDEPIRVPGTDLDVRSAAWPHWAGILHRAARHRADPTYTFRRVLIPYADAAHGIHEVASIEQLHALADARAERHNALHNARHVIEPLYQPLVDRVEQTYTAAPPVSDDRPFIEARAALAGFDLDARLRTEAAPERQRPTAPRPPAPDWREPFFQRLRAAAARRLATILGTDQTWAAVLVARTHDTGRLVALVETGSARITGTADRADAAAIEADVLARIESWAPEIDVEASHSSLTGERGIALLVTATASATIIIQPTQQAPDGTVQKLPDDRYRIDDWQTDAAAIVTIGPGSARRRIRFADALDGQTVVVIRLYVRASTSGPNLFHRDVAVGAIP